MLHKAIKGYEDYLVTDDGRVYSLKSQRYLKPTLKSVGYLYVNLFNTHGDKHLRVHRLVAKAFIPNPNNLPHVDHINRDKTDNSVGNLRWCTPSENNRNRDHYSLNRKAKGIAIVEKYNEEVSIGYLSMRSVPVVDKGSFQHHLQQGKSHFYCKGREFFTEPKA